MINFVQNRVQVQALIQYFSKNSKHHGSIIVEQLSEPRCYHFMKKLEPKRI